MTQARRAEDQPQSVGACGKRFGLLLKMIVATAVGLSIAGVAWAMAHTETFDGRIDDNTERLVKVETVIVGIDDKLDLIITKVK